MSAADEIRLSEFDRSCDLRELPEAVAEDLFGVIATVSSSLGLRRAFTDPASTAGARQQLARKVFSTRVSEAALTVLDSALALNWRNPHSLLDALERQGIRVLLKNAELGEAVEQLQSFVSTVSDNPGLRDMLQDSSYDAAHREELVSSLVRGKVLDIVEQLLRRAVRTSRRDYAITVQRYLQIAAQLRSRQIALVTVAKDLTAEQTARLRGTLSRQVGRELDLQIMVDPLVIGGMRVQIADDLIESTVAGRLEDVQRQFSS